MKEKLKYNNKLCKLILHNFWVEKNILRIMKD